MVGRKRKWLIGMLAAIGLVAVANVPTTRYVGSGRAVVEERLPLWIKTLNFLDRHVNMDRWADSVLGGVHDDEARALRALAWTYEHIRPTPPGLTSPDDHVWYTVLRGYGEADQQADVFTTLLVYAGVPAFWTLIGTRPDELPLSYARIRGEWRVFDVAHNLAFRRPDGVLATAGELVDLTAVRQAAAAVVEERERYLSYFQGYRPPLPPDALRAELHMPARRLRHAMASVFGVEGRTWEMRPGPVTQKGERR